MVVDTNILIDSLRGKADAVHFLESAETSYSISVISVTELIAGIRGSSELGVVQDFLASFVIHPVDEATSKLAGEYLNRYFKSHQVGIADALIAATATIHGEELATLNVKHFPMLGALVRPY